MCKDIPIIPNAVPPNTIRGDNTLNAATLAASVAIEPATSKICLNFKFSVAFVILPSAVPKTISPSDRSDIVNEPRDMNDAVVGSPITAVASANITSEVAIIPTCFHVTFSVAFVILPSAIPNIIRDALITNITSDPIKASFFAFSSNLNVRLHTVTIPNRKIEPNIACGPVIAIVERNKEDIAINPENAINVSDVLIIPFIFFLFSASFSTTRVVILTTAHKASAPNIAVAPNAAEIVKNIDVINK